MTVAIELPVTPGEEVVSAVEIGEIHRFDGRSVVLLPGNDPPPEPVKRTELPACNGQQSIGRQQRTEIAQQLDSALAGGHMVQNAERYSEPKTARCCDR